MLKNALFRWFPFAIVATFVCILSYGIGQQVLRQTADDTQVQMAEDTASVLSTGQKPKSVIPVYKVDMSRSLAPFLIIYDDNKHVNASSGAINGQVPLLPSGVLDSARGREDHITWQPSPGVRIAAVIVSFNGKQSGYVLAGRSLREVEQHEGDIENQVFIVWIVFLIVLYSYFLLAEFFKKRKLVS